MVASHDDRDDAAAGHLADRGPDVGVPDLGLPVWAVGVSEVDDLEPVEDLDAQVEVVRARHVRAGADGPGSEPRSWSVRGRDVERRSDDGHVRSPRVELLGLGQPRPLTECGKAGVHEVELFSHPGRQIALRR